MRTHLPLVLVMAFWGSAFAASKTAVDAVPHQVAAAIRFLGGGLVLLAALPFARGSSTRLAPRDVGVVAGLGVVGVSGYNIALFLGLTMAPAADASVLIPALSPVCTTIVPAALSRSRLPNRKLTGLLCALAGAAVFLTGIPAGGQRLPGDLLYLAGALCWSVYTVCGGPVLRRLPTLTVTAYATTIGGLVLAVAALPVLGDVRWSTVDSGFWLDEAYLVLLPTAAAYALFYQGVRRLGPASAATMMFLVPVFGLGTAVLLLHESITPVQLGGSALMLAGAWLTTRSQPARAASAIELASRAPATIASQHSTSQAATPSRSPEPKAVAVEE